MPDELHPAEREELELSDLLNRVLDKGVCIAGTVVLSVADVDLVRLGLSVVLHSIETRPRAPGTIARAAGGLTDTTRADVPADDPSVLPPRAR